MAILIAGAKKLSFTVSPTLYLLMFIATCVKEIIPIRLIFPQARQIPNIILTIWL